MAARQSLAALLEGLPVTAAVGDLEATLALPVAGLTDDSRAVTAGDVFVAVAGGAEDGHRHAEAALRAGAVAVLAERAVQVSGPVLLVEGLKSARSTLADRA